MTPAHLARTLWHRLEPLNAVTYFGPESRQAFDGLGFQGFWMGYFASRAAPMGAVTAGAVEATFFNFHPARVLRAIPEAWTHATPRQVIATRADAAAASLRRVLSTELAETTASLALDPLRAVVDAATSSGRPLFAGNQGLARPDDPVGALWQSATALREHRGDGHVSILVSAGLSGLESLVLFSSSEGIEPRLFMERRGWDEEDWQRATDVLRRRGLLDSESLTPAGFELRAEVERRTDELAIGPYATLDDNALDNLLAALDRAARVVEASGMIPFPNPMGLPPLAGTRAS